MMVAVKFVEERRRMFAVTGTPKENLWHYCLNCGAKMDERVGDNA